MGIIRLNRPEKLNAINMEMVYDLVEALNELKSQVRAVIITGNGKAFSAGADVKEMLDMSIEQVTREGHMPLWDALRGSGNP